mmetsp:Transcript_19702/g.32379  ORF Transcript_19702/g.32379 Transcript_19702/m.32379 type:complete len:236 (-) Transcript_19702:660-1367(-)
MDNVFTRTVAPAIGVVVSQFLFLGPLSAVLECRRLNELGAVNPYVFPMIWANCIGWVSYGFFSMNLYITLGNLFGIFWGLFYSFSAYGLTQNWQVKRRLEALVIVIGFLWTVLCLIMLYQSSEVARKVVGIVATTMAMALFLSPLVTMLTVIKEKDSASINRGFMIAQIINCGMWSLYGLVIVDPFVIIPNVFGFGLGIAQLVLVFMFPNRKSKGKTSHARVPSAIQTVEIVAKS